MFVPDLKKACIHDILPFSEAANDFESLGTKVLIISSDGAATEEDIRFPIIGNSQLAVEYGMQDTFGLFILDQHHRLRSAQLSQGTSSSNVQETLKLILALKYTEKWNIITPPNWESLTNKTIWNHQEHKKQYYKTYIQKDVPVTADGVEDYKVEEVWAGPAVYGEQIFT